VSSLRALERFARSARRAREGQRCELCALAIAAEHRHVVDCTARKLLCACTPCVLAFAKDHGRFRSVPEQVRIDPKWTIDERRLEALGVPVGLAFFLHPSSTGRWMAVFPSPAGATEADLEPDAWESFARGSTLATSVSDDVEALFVRRTRDGKCSCFVVPVDVCYELTALLRSRWKGIDGGDDARAAVDDFVSRLAARAEMIS
jgi:hypothetical protein